MNLKALTLKSRGGSSINNNKLFGFLTQKLFCQNFNFSNFATYFLQKFSAN